MRTCEMLAAELEAGAGVEVDVVVQALRNYRSPHRLFHDWQHEEDREEVARRLGDKFGLEVDVQVTSNADHGRKLQLEYADGQKVMILLDQGFGYWRVVGRPPSFDFHAAPAAQASDLIRTSTTVAGQGESYFAIKRL